MYFIVRVYNKFSEFNKLKIEKLLLCRIVLWCKLIFNEFRTMLIVYKIY